MANEKAVEVPQMLTQLTVPPRLNCGVVDGHDVGQCTPCASVDANLEDEVQELDRPGNLK